MKTMLRINTFDNEEDFTMMRSMFSGVSALRAHQARMDVVAHNIANVNTVGFKSSRMTFSETFSQTMQGASAPNAELGRGGTNPQQIGLGANIGNISRIMTEGAAQRTDDPLHLMIEGSGFFVVGGVDGLFFTRAGDFFEDAIGQITMPNGMLLQGWPATQNNGHIGDITMGPVQGVAIQPWMRSTPPSATGNIALRGNIRPGANEVPSQISFRDSLGNNWTWQKTITPAINADGITIAGEWDVTFANTIRRADGATFDVDPDAVNFSMEFNQAGELVAPTFFDIEFPEAFQTAFATAFGANIGQQLPDAAAADPAVLRLGLSGVRQVGELASSVVQHTEDGRVAGNLNGFSIGPDGILTGHFSNGDQRALWQIAIATFDNPAGLESLGGNIFGQTPNSGAFDGIGVTPATLGSRLLPGTIEMSNVDLAGEFTEMITTQRGFQANSRVISTSDEMIQELVNLRR